MAYQLSALVTSVQNRVKDSGFDTSLIKEYLNDTERDIYAEYRLNFMEKSQPYTTVANVADITNGTGLPTDYLVAIDLLNTATGRVITYRDISYLDEVGPDTDEMFWYKYADTIYLYPTQTSAYSLSLRYYKSPPELTSDTDVPTIPEMFREIMVLGASWRVMEVKDNYDQAAVLRKQYARKLDQLVGQTSVNQVGSSPKQRINRQIVGKRNF